MTIERLTEAISAVCPIHGIGGTVERRIDYRDEATVEQRTAAQAALAEFDWSQAAHDAWELAKRKSLSIDAIAMSRDTLIVALRGTIVALVAELNRQRAWNAALKTAVANASTFAQLKTNIATLNNVTPITKPQVRQAIADQINAGNAES